MAATTSTDRGHANERTQPTATAGKTAERRLAAELRARALVAASWPSSPRSQRKRCAVTSPRRMPRHVAGGRGEEGLGHDAATLRAVRRPARERSRRDAPQRRTRAALALPGVLAVVAVLLSAAFGVLLRSWRRPGRWRCRRKPRRATSPAAMFHTRLCHGVLRASGCCKSQSLLPRGSRRQEDFRPCCSVTVLPVVIFDGCVAHGHESPGISVFPATTKFSQLMMKCDQRDIRRRVPSSMAPSVSCRILSLFF